jgi:hypothetical protein
VRTPARDREPWLALTTLWSKSACSNTRCVPRGNCSAPEPLRWCDLPLLGLLACHRPKPLCRFIIGFTPAWQLGGNHRWPRHGTYTAWAAGGGVRDRVNAVTSASPATAGRWAPHAAYFWLGSSSSSSSRQLGSCPGWTAAALAFATGTEWRSQDFDVRYSHFPSNMKQFKYRWQILRYLYIF